MNDDKKKPVETSNKFKLPAVEAPEELANTDLDDVAGGCETGSTGVGCIGSGSISVHART